MEMTVKRGQALKTLPNAPIPRAVNDGRVNEDRQLEVERTAFRAELEIVIERSNVAIDNDAKETVLRNVVYINQNAKVIQEKWIQMGEFLLNIHKTSKDLYDAITKSDNRILPFSRTVAHKIKQAAEEVRKKRVPANILPLTYPAAYEVSLMDEPVLKKALSKDLIKPSTSRERLFKIRKEIEAEIRSANRDITPQSLRAQIARLEQRKDELEDEYRDKLRKIDEELEKLRVQLDDRLGDRREAITIEGSLANKSHEAVSSELSSASESREGDALNKEAA
jgi:hypothetical protein